MSDRASFVFQFRVQGWRVVQQVPNSAYAAMVKVVSGQRIGVAFVFAHLGPPKGTEMSFVFSLLADRS